MAKDSVTGYAEIIIRVKDAITLMDSNRVSSSCQNDIQITNHNVQMF